MTVANLDNVRQEQYLRVSRHSGGPIIAACCHRLRHAIVHQDVRGCRAKDRLPVAARPRWRDEVIKTEVV
jgi:metal-dependent hydrolase (beta-lactamase superfamily II)